MGTIVIRLEPAPPGQAGTPTVRLLVDDGSAVWADSPVASRSLPAALPPPPNGLTGADAAESIRDAVLTLDGAGTDVFQRMGRYLFDVLLGDGMQDAWEQASSAPDGPHRVVFDIRVDELVALPWELLEHDDVRPFFGQDVIPSRGRYPFGTPREAELGPLKVLQRRRSRRALPRRRVRPSPSPA